MAIPSIALIPSGYKANKVYSVLPTDGAGDLATTRASSATRVNKEGLLETVSTGVPRLDYSDGGCPSLLLEPQRTNSALYSEDLSNPAWSKENSTINSNQTISPKGDLTADLLSATTTTGSYFIDVLSVTPAQKYTYSIFAKKSNSDYFAFVIVDGANIIRQYYNVSDGTVGITNNSGSPIVENIKIENYGNGWYRCSLTIQALNSAVEVRNYVIQNDGIATAPIGSEIFLWGIQSEQGSYATSYIPTAGAIATRLADTASKTGISSLIGQTEGTMFLNADIQKFNDSSFYIAISNGLTLTSAIYMLQPSTGTLQIQKRNAGLDTVLDITTGNWSAGFNKVAIVYTTTSLKVFINGVQKGSSSFSGLPPFTRFSLGSRPDQAGALVPKTEYKQVKLYNTALTDAELIALTTL